MNKSSLDLFCDHEYEHEQDADLEIERRAAELEITVDYYMAEFM